jgi:hypothetical protein
MVGRTKDGKVILVGVKTEQEGRGNTRKMGRTKKSKKQSKVREGTSHEGA